MGTFIIKFAGADFSVLMHFPCCEFVLFYFPLLFTRTGKALTICSGTLMGSFTTSCVQGWCSVSSAPECECFFSQEDTHKLYLCMQVLSHNKTNEYTNKQRNKQKPKTGLYICIKQFVYLFLRYWDRWRCTGGEPRKIKDLWMCTCLPSSLVVNVMLPSGNPLLNAQALNPVCSTLCYSNQDILEEKIISAGAHHQCRSMSSSTQIHSKDHVLTRTTARLSHSKAQAGSVCTGERWKMWKCFRVQETYLAIVTSTNP